eukprot:6257719-Amphidinium_carterae.2
MAQRPHPAEPGRNNLPNKAQDPKHSRVKVSKTKPAQSGSSACQNGHRSERVTTNTSVLQDKDQLLRSGHTLEFDGMGYFQNRVFPYRETVANVCHRDLPIVSQHDNRKDCEQIANQTCPLGSSSPGTKFFFDK